MKRLLISTTLLVCVIASAMMLSSFSTSKYTAKTESSQIEVGADSWKVFREKVPFCDAANDVCKGYGYVWVNTDTYQIAFSYNFTSTKYDLSEYTKYEGYNMRFWDNSNKAYYYVNIYVPKSAFE